MRSWLSILGEELCESLAEIEISYYYFFFNSTILTLYTPKKKRLSSSKVTLVLTHGIFLLLRPHAPTWGSSVW